MYSATAAVFPITEAIDRALRAASTALATRWLVRESGGWSIIEAGPADLDSAIEVQYATANSDRAEDPDFDVYGTLHAYAGFLTVAGIGCWPRESAARTIGRACGFARESIGHHPSLTNLVTVCNGYPTWAARREADGRIEDAPVYLGRVWSSRAYPLSARLRGERPTVDPETLPIAVDGCSWLHVSPSSDESALWEAVVERVRAIEVAEPYGEDEG